MTQEDKNLVIKDICARLPYGVKIHIGKTQRIEVFDDINLRIGSINNTYADIRPYLFPLSSMTEEQQKEANLFDDMDMDILSENLGRNHRNKTNIPTATHNYTDWLNKNHFDYRGLISKGLAIDATGLNIYKEERL